MGEAGNPLHGLRPPAPPSELRDRVLQAARLASAQRDVDVFARLAADRALRWCAVVLVVLALAHAVMTGPRVSTVAHAPSTTPVIDGIGVPSQGGLTAADQRSIGRTDG